jgi:hypothetical protein
MLLGWEKEFHPLFECDFALDHKTIRNEREVGAFSGAQHVLQSFHERPLLIVFEQQVAQWASLGLARSHDSGNRTPSSL